MFLPLTNYEFDFGMKYDFNIEIILFHHFLIVSGNKN